MGQLRYGKLLQVIEDGAHGQEDLPNTRELMCLTILNGFTTLRAGIQRWGM